MTALEQKIIARIEELGALSFRDFMQMALYDAELGYYNTERLKIGAAGDYYTSSNVHPAFGAILAQAFAGLWSELAAVDQPFTLMEMGAGTGQLAFDVLTALGDEHPALFERLDYLIIEQSPVMRARQQEKLAGFQGRVIWRELAELAGAGLTAIAFSNELVDALPVHRVRFRQGRVEELYVMVNDTADRGRQLAFAWRGLSRQALGDYIKRAAVRFSEGQVIEINLDAVDWLRRLFGAFERGFLVTVDYGDEAAHLYSPERRDGTLRCFYRHRLNDVPLERIGEQDITASVNFSALTEYGRDIGFETVSYERQTHFLFRMGLIERVAALESGGGIDDLKSRLAIKNLLAPGGVSDNFRVLIQKKN